MPTHPKGKRPFALKNAKPFTKAQLAEQARKLQATLRGPSSNERIVEQTPRLKGLYEYLDKVQPRQR